MMSRGRLTTEIRMLWSFGFDQPDLPLITQLYTAATVSSALHHSLMAHTCDALFFW